MSSSQLILKARFPKDFFTTEMLSLSNIPCVCKIADGRFVIQFEEPLVNVEGEILEFEISDIDKRAPAGGDGKYVHYSFAMVTLRPLAEDTFLVHDLLFFKRVSPGWFSIIREGQWGEPWGEEVSGEHSNAEGVRESRQSKKRKRLFDLLGKIENGD